VLGLYAHPPTRGNYAVSIEWSDGHSGSIYPYEYLKLLNAEVAEMMSEAKNAKGDTTADDRSAKAAPASPFAAPPEELGKPVVEVHSSGCGTEGHVHSSACGQKH
jgi:hypothetical protein